MVTVKLTGYVDTPLGCFKVYINHNTLDTYDGCPSVLVRYVDQENKQWWFCDIDEIKDLKLELNEIDYSENDLESEALSNCEYDGRPY